MTHYETVSSHRNQQPLVNRQAMYRLLEHLAAHGRSLNAVLRQVRADTDVEDIRELEDLSEGALAGNSDAADRLAAHLHALVAELIHGVGDVMCDVEGGHTGPDFDQALCWHAGRLQDLAHEIRVRT